MRDLDLVALRVPGPMPVGPAEAGEVTALDGDEGLPVEGELDGPADQPVKDLSRHRGE